MCWNIDWFNTCKTCDEGFVTLASNVECKIVGIDKIKVKMLDGTMKVLGNVRHVLELGRNLILLCRLDALGNGYFARGGIMKDVLCVRIMFSYFLFLVKGFYVISYS